MHYQAPTPKRYMTPYNGKKQTYWSNSEREWQGSMDIYTASRPQIQTSVNAEPQRRVSSIFSLDVPGGTIFDRTYCHRRKTREGTSPSTWEERHARTRRIGSLTWRPSTRRSDLPSGPNASTTLQTSCTQRNSTAHDYHNHHRINISHPHKPRVKR